MLELSADLLARVRGRIPFVAATVTRVAGSAPRQPGTSLVVAADGAVLGNVSGGCVDSAVHQACQSLRLHETSSLFMSEQRTIVPSDNAAPAGPAPSPAPEPTLEAR